MQKNNYHYTWIYLPCSIYCNGYDILILGSYRFSKKYKNMQTNDKNPWRCNWLLIHCLLGIFCSTWKISLFAIATHYKSLLGVNVSYLSLCVLFITVIKNTSWYSIFMYWSKKRNIDSKTTEANIMKIRLISIHDWEDIINKNWTT